MTRIALVTPWYGDDIPGGAEAECRTVAKTLLSGGFEVEILTTCVREFRSDWNENYYSPGETTENGVHVRRFLVRRRDTASFDAVNWKLMNDVPISEREEQIYVAEMVNSPHLYDFIQVHQNEYVFLFIPYMFGTTYWGSRVCPHRSILIPCLHDEPYARMGVFRSMFESVRGAIFHSPEEAELARRLCDIAPEKIRVLGEPVECTLAGDATRAKRKYGLNTFLLYAGRTDKGKNAELLAEYFSRYISETCSDLQLVFIGSVDAPASSDRRILSLGFVPSRDKHDLYAGALALCVPSVVESFSLVMMESWLAGTPVLVNAACAVTTGFCRRSNGGLYFEDYAEFREIVDELQHRPKLAKALGAQGGAYVRRHFLPNVIAERYAAVLSEWFPDDELKLR